ncbi:MULTISPECIES: hypothetical protein [unclassified Pseudomonas]|uniref:hypothetical protein n=1 Tax=unclassified Pseudomonas TaxID=196821 RepID=UPI0039B73F14
MNAYNIGTETTLTNKEWIEAYLATLKDGEETDETYDFLKANRYPNDGIDEELQVYQQLCTEKGIEF